MSLVGSTRDALQDVRKKSLLQEQHIDRNGVVAHWRLTGDATKVTLIERAVGFAVLPVFFAWVLLVSALGLWLVAMGVLGSICLAAFKLLGRFFR